MAKNSQKMFLKKTVKKTVKMVKNSGRKKVKKVSTVKNNQKQSKTVKIYQKWSKTELC